MSTTRRDFLSRASMAAAAVGACTTELSLPAEAAAESVKKLSAPVKPVMITKVNAEKALESAYKMLLDDADTLDAALHICVDCENDPRDTSVGLGGMPNEEGVVELDASVMHGPTRGAGAVAAVRNIKNVSLLARTVMERTGHVMLVGEGAERFAVAYGFKREDLLTEDSRKAWLLWKENHSDGDWWGPGMASPAWKDSLENKAGSPQSRIPRNPSPEWAPYIQQRSKELMAMAADLGIAPNQRAHAVRQVLWPTTGTVHVSAVDTKGQMSGATSTSGMAWKIPGRVGDSPIIGAGCFTDQDVGSAGATGSGEENITIAGAATIVELMRQGLSPKEAGLEALRRLVRIYNGDKKKVRYLDMIYYILRKDGAYAGCSLWSTGPNGKPRSFIVHDGTLRTEKCDFLLEGSYTAWPPF
jgi:N4-(beta-N-acetylglucosaminyl)-L-asparaginase